LGEKNRQRKRFELPLREETKIKKAADIRKIVVEEKMRSS
jgi:hypothetical protein